MKIALLFLFLLPGLTLAHSGSFGCSGLLRSFGSHHAFLDHLSRIPVAQAAQYAQRSTPTSANEQTARSAQSSYSVREIVETPLQLDIRPEEIQILDESTESYFYRYVQTTRTYSPIDGRLKAKARLEGSTLIIEDIITTIEGGFSVRDFNLKRIYTDLLTYFRGRFDSVRETLVVGNHPAQHTHLRQINNSLIEQGLGHLGYLSNKEKIEFINDRQDELIKAIQDSDLGQIYSDLGLTNIRIINLSSGASGLSSLSFIVHI